MDLMPRRIADHQRRGCVCGGTVAVVGSIPTAGSIAVRRILTALPPLVVNTGQLCESRRTTVLHMSADDSTSRVLSDAPFRRMLLDARLGRVRLEAVKAVFRQAFGDLPNAGHLVVCATLLRGGGRRWFVIAVDSETGDEVPVATLGEALRLLEAVP